MAAAEESTPLLGTSSPQPEEGGETSSSPLLASAPPPADAPPSPPKEAEVPLNDGNNKSSSSSSHKKQYSSTSIDNTIDDTTSHQSQLSKKSSGRRSKKKRGGGGGESSSNSARSSKSKKKKSKQQQQQYDGPKKSIFHLAFDMVRYMAILASCMMLLMQIIPIVILDEGEITGLQYFVRIYLIVICVSFVLVESRIPLLRRRAFPAHNNWMLRGFMYTFIGVIGMEQDVAIKVEDIASGTSNILGPDYGTLFASLSIAITTWIMVGVGILYMILGMMCLQRWYEKLDEEHRNKVSEWKRKKKREKEFQKDREEYVKYEKDRREGRGEWYDDIETQGSKGGTDTRWAG